MVTFDYGMKDRNPIDEVRFYGKSNPDKPLFFRKDEVCCCFSIQVDVYVVKFCTHEDGA